MSGLEEKRLSRSERKKRFAPSCWIASFSVKYDLLVVCLRWLRNKVGSGPTLAM